MLKRIEFIDIARGIGILLVVLGHNDFGYISPFAHQVIYSFHMPLFFFLSGYFLNTTVGFSDFALKRFNALLKPYYFTIFMIYFMSISFGIMGFPTAVRRIVKSLYASGYYLDWVQLWFLPHLFVVSLYSFFFYKLTIRLNNRVLRWALLVLTLWVASLFLKNFYPFSVSVLGRSYTFFGLPFSLDLTLLSGFFFIMGGEIRQTVTERTFENPFLLLGSGAGMLLLNFFFRQQIDFNTRLYESFLINTSEAIIGILFVLTLSRQIDLRFRRLAATLKYFGRISLILLIFHVPIQALWGQKILAMTDNLPLSIWGGFVMGVAGSALLHELFFKANPVASWWIGRQVETADRVR
ncbi:MAG: acyltransferase family protein [Chloroflexota bacterium]|nr:acyltransferase family protein [Chloroflexota bacterium]MBI5703129.1 acyltransferase family protein [Chloroflexota bacterium]